MNDQTSFLTTNFTRKEDWYKTFLAAINFGKKYENQSDLTHFFAS